MIPCDVLQNEAKKKVHYVPRFLLFRPSFAFKSSTLRLNLNANKHTHTHMKSAQISRYLMAPVAAFRQTSSGNHILLFASFFYIGALPLMP